MSEALAQAGALPSEVDYLEAHATGSQLGDPIELNAAASVYGKGRDPERPLLVGSVKSNIGHTESAAGMAALIKTVLAMNRGVIPQHLHFDDPNPHVEWDDIPVRVASDATDWPDVSGRRPLAGVNAFGLSGANAHVLVEGYEPPLGPSESNGAAVPEGSSRPVPLALPDTTEAAGEESPERATRFLPLSARSAGSLRDLAERYGSWLDGEECSASSETLSDLAWTASTGRGHFPHRAGVVFADAAQLRQRLETVAATYDAPDQPPPEPATRVALAFSAHGSQWPGMGESLYRTEPVARAVLDRCDELMREERGISLLDVLFGAEQNLDEPACARPAVYALECAIAAQWASVGIRPNAVVGSGPGGLAAAQATGAITLEEGLRLAAAFGALEASPDEGALEGLEAALAAVSPEAPSGSLINGVTGRGVESVDEIGADYWRSHDRDALDPAACAGTLAQLGVDIVIDLGPDAVLGPALDEAWPDSSDAPVVLSTLACPPAKGESAEPGDGFMNAVAAAYDAGLDLAFAGLFAGESRRRVALPTYPFQRKRHWF